MAIADILLPVTDSRPLCVSIRRGDGQYWDWVAGAYAIPATVLDVARFSRTMAHDAVFPAAQRIVIPGAAASDPQAEAIVCLSLPGGMPIPSESWWLGAPEPAPAPAPNPPRGRITNSAGQMISFP